MMTRLKKNVKPNIHNNSAVDNREEENVVSRNNNYKKTTTTTTTTTMAATTRTTIKNNLHNLFTCIYFFWVVCVIVVVADRCCCCRCCRCRLRLYFTLLCTNIVLFAPFHQKLEYPVCTQTVLVVVFVRPFQITQANRVWMHEQAGDQERSEWRNGNDREKERERERVKWEIKWKKKLKKLYGWVIVAANTYRSAATFYTNKCAQTRPRARDRSIHSICLFRFNLLSQVIVNTIYCAYSLSRTVPHSRSCSCTHAFSRTNRSVPLSQPACRFIFSKHWCNCCSVTKPHRAYIDAFVWMYSCTSLALYCKWWDILFWICRTH